MTDSQERVSLELIEAGDHKERVIQVLEKVKGLNIAPEQVVNSAPCTIASNVPRHLAEKLQGFLEQVGAMVLIESEENLFSPDDLPGAPEEPDLLADESAFSDDSPDPSEDDWLADAFPQASSRDDDLAGDFQAVTVSDFNDEPFDDEEDMDFDTQAQEDEEAAPGKIQQLLARVKAGVKKKKEGKSQATQKTGKKFSLPKFRKDSDDTSEEAAAPKPSLLERFKRKKSSEERTGDEDDNPTIRQGDSEDKTAQERILGFVLPTVVGFLLGATIMGLWGWSSIRGTQREAEEETLRRLNEYDQKVAKQIEQHSAELRAKVQEQQEAITELNRRNSDLAAQLQQAQTRVPQSITPSLNPVSAVPAPNSLMSEFEALKTRHAQVLEQSYNTQKQAACARQVLLDGKSTSAYAQVVRKFSAKFTSFDIMQSDSLVTPFVAELKIPFREELRSGPSADACRSAAFQQLSVSPVHHEFGSFYGYWIVQYVYKNGKWQVKPTVIEKNRALYESAFQHGSPDFAKFLLESALLNELKQP